MKLTKIPSFIKFVLWDNMTPALATIFVILPIIDLGKITEPSSLVNLGRILFDASFIIKGISVIMLDVQSIIETRYGKEVLDRWDD